MKWRKRGRIYAADGSLPWAKQYGHLTTPLFLNETTLRIYVAFCDENTVGRVGFVDVRADNPSAVVNVSKRPVLDVGCPGAFDENGVVPTSVIRLSNKLYLYYVGYQLGYKVRYYQFTGLAISSDGGNNFERCSRVPVIDRTDKEMLNRTAAFVRYEQGIFKMWYVGGDDWIVVNGKSLPRYNIRYIESSDGVSWPKEGEVCVDFSSDDEHVLGRPYLIERAGLYRMFYSVRTKSRGYRIGYAESNDAQHWVRKDDQVGIDVSPNGWDSEMIAYASVLEYKGAFYMFYNGNNCGQTGFGYAVLEHW